VAALQQAFHDSAQRHCHTVNFWWKSFGNNRNPEAGGLRNIGLNEDVFWIYHVQYPSWLK
jgi:hypothetical protein